MDNHRRHPSETEATPSLESKEYGLNWFQLETPEGEKKEETTIVRFRYPDVKHEKNLIDMKSPEAHKMHEMFREFQKEFLILVEHAHAGKLGLGRPYVTREDGRLRLTRAIFFVGARADVADLPVGLKSSQVTNIKRFGLPPFFSQSRNAPLHFVGFDSLLTISGFHKYVESVKREYGPSATFVDNLALADETEFFNYLPDPGVMDEIRFAVETVADADYTERAFREYRALLDMDIDSKKFIEHNIFGKRGEKINVARILETFPDWFIEHWDEPASNIFPPYTEMEIPLTKYTGLRSVDSDTRQTEDLLFITDTNEIVIGVATWGNCKDASEIIIIKKINGIRIDQITMAEFLRRVKKADFNSTDLSAAEADRLSDLITKMNRNTER